MSKCRVNIKNMKSLFSTFVNSEYTKTSVILDSETGKKPSKLASESNLKEAAKEGLKCSLCPEDPVRPIRYPAGHWTSAHPEQPLTSLRLIRVQDGKIANLSFFYKMILKCFGPGCGFITVANKQPNDAKIKMRKHIKELHNTDKDINMEELEVKQLGYRCLAENCMQAPADRRQMIDHHTKRHPEKELKARDLDADTINDITDLYKFVEQCKDKCANSFYADTSDELAKQRARHKCAHLKEVEKKGNKHLEKLVVEDMQKEQLEELDEDDVKAVTRILDEL